MSRTFPSYPPVPPAVRGLWQRTLLEGPGIPTDTSTRVYWLQTAHWHGDLRIPAGRPPFEGCARLADCTPAQREWLGSQRGFAGLTEVTRQPAPGAGGASDVTVCQWHRQFDRHPATGARDIGRIVLSADDAVLEEYGIDADYHETWVRVAAGEGVQHPWRRAPARSDGFDEFLLVSGSCFFLLRDPADTEAARAAPGQAGAAQGAPTDASRLELELSFGVWDPVRALGRITLSTLPWREGAQVERAADATPLDGGNDA